MGNMGHWKKIMGLTTAMCWMLSMHDRSEFEPWFINHTFAYSKDFWESCTMTESGRQNVHEKTLDTRGDKAKRPAIEFLRKMNMSHYVFPI